MSLTLASGDVAFSGSLTATATSATYHLPGGVNNSLFVGVHVSAVSGTSPTLAVKLQDSADGVTFADVTGAATAANLTAAGNATFFGRSAKPYVRLVATVGGTTPNFTASVVLLGVSV